MKRIKFASLGLGILAIIKLIKILGITSLMFLDDIFAISFGFSGNLSISTIIFFSSVSMLIWYYMEKNGNNK